MQRPRRDAAAAAAGAGSGGPPFQVAIPLYGHEPELAGAEAEHAECKVAGLGSLPTLASLTTLASLYSDEILAGANN